MPARTGELGHEPGWIGSAAQAECGEIQAGRPALRPGLERLHGSRVQAEAERAVEELLRLFLVEPELVGPDFQHRPHRAETTQWQDRIRPCRDDEVERIRHAGDQSLDQVVSGSAAQHVVVIQDQDQRLAVVEGIEQPLQHDTGRVDSRRDEVAIDVVGDGRTGRAERGDEPGHEARSVAVTLCDREPGSPVGIAARPGGEQGRLPEPGRRGHQGQWARCRVIERAEESLARDVFRSGRRRVELRAADEWTSAGYTRRKCRLRHDVSCSVGGGLLASKR